MVESSNGGVPVAVESIMKSTNMISGKMQPTLLANGLLSHTNNNNNNASQSSSTSGGALHFQHTLSPDKPEDLSSHLTFTTTTINGYHTPASSLASSESVNNNNTTINNMLSKTTGTTTTTLVGAAPKPVINLRDLSIDSLQLQNLQQQQSIYDIVYQQKGGVGGSGGSLTPGPGATATASGRRRTISNNSTG